MNRGILLVIVLAGLGFAQPATTSTSRVRFTSVNIAIDPKGEPLAAYQIEFVADASHVKLVGIEGGEHKAFSDPPYYDPAALSHNRVILAAFSTQHDLPTGATRIAKLHVQITGDETPELHAKLIVAASEKNASIPAQVTVSEGAKP